ncbi:MAG TPA: hypothetical protein VKW06_07000 [Candidatus Angelobacter sp.]|nr:hypothetical protein [Candidatus Angelobacter sp.]
MRSTLFAFVIAAVLPASAQTPSADPGKLENSSAPAAQASQPAAAPANVQASDAAPAPAPQNTRQITLPAGTEVLLQLKNAIDTKSARIGDGVYCQTTFPVVVDNIMIIPPGSYVKGEITRVQRAGRLSGRAEILFHFDSVIFPTGYTVEMPGSIHGDSGTHNGKVADDEGTVKTEGHDKLKKLPDVGRDAEYGSIGGVIASGSLNGARIGGGIGAVAGLATMLLTRGSDVRIESGAALTMRLQRPLVVDVEATSAQAGTQVVPRQTNTRLPMPASANKPQ